MEPNSPQKEEEKLEPIQEEGTRTPDDHVVEDPPPPEKIEVDQTPHEVHDTVQDDVKNTGSAGTQGHAHGTGSAETAQQPMAGRSQADDSKTAKKRNRCGFAETVGVHGYRNALEYCYERYKKESRPDPRLDLNVLPLTGPRPEYVTAVIDWQGPRL
eukprot:3173814-Pyramimonas_sp.AAC.1